MSAIPPRRWIGLSLVAAASLSSACGGGGGGSGGGSTAASELGDWSIGTVAMSGDDSFLYESARLRFSERPSQVQFSAQHGDTVYSWTGDYQKNADAITTGELAEASDATDLVMLDLALVSDTSLTGTVTETYPMNGGTVTGLGTIDATR